MVLRPRESPILEPILGWWGSGDILSVGLPRGMTMAIPRVARPIRLQTKVLLWVWAGFQPPLFSPSIVYKEQFVKLLQLVSSCFNAYASCLCGG